MRTILAKEARDQIVVGTASIGLLVGNHWRTGIRRGQHSRRFRHDPEQRNRENFLDVIDREHLALGDTRRVVARQQRSEERRVGKAWGSKCGSRWWPDNEK